MFLPESITKIVRNSHPQNGHPQGLPLPGRCVPLIAHPLSVTSEEHSDEVIRDTFIPNQKPHQAEGVDGVFGSADSYKFTGYAGWRGQYKPVIACGAE